MFGFEHHMFTGLHDGWMWGMHLGWWLVWGLLIAGVVWAASRKQNVPSHSERETPLEVLKRRYADGEITTEEYEERKERL